MWNFGAIDFVDSSKLSSEWDRPSMLLDINDDGFISTRLIGNQSAAKYCGSIRFHLWRTHAVCVWLGSTWIAIAVFSIEIVELSIKYVASPTRGRAIAARNDLRYTTTMVLASTIIVKNEDLKIV